MLSAGNRAACSLDTDFATARPFSAGDMNYTPVALARQSVVRESDSALLNRRGASRFPNFYRCKALRIAAFFLMLRLTSPFHQLAGLSDAS
jgi:hypothetical protein